MAFHPVRTSIRYAQRPSDEGAVLYIDQNPITLSFTVGTYVNEEVNTIVGVSPEELRRLGQILIAAADAAPPLTHASACPATSGGKCFCRAKE